MKSIIVLAGGALLLAACGPQAAEKAGAKADSVINEATGGKIDSTGVVLQKAGEKVDTAAAGAAQESKKLAGEAKVEAQKAGAAVKSEVKKADAEIKDATQKKDN